MNEQVLRKVETFFSTYKEQLYRKGEILVRADENPTGVFYLKEGVVKEYALSQKGDELIVNTFKKCSFFPMSWALNQTSNTYFFEAATPLHIYKAPREDVVQFMQANPDVVFDLMQRVYKGIEGLLTRITYLMAGSAYGRVIAELLIQARRFGVPHGKSVVISISESQLASYTGMTRETISREISVLKRKGLVTFEKSRVTVIDLGLLELELSGGI